MNIELLKAFFMWSSIINLSVMMLSALIIVRFSDWAYQIHSRWFKISRSSFDIAIYSFLGLYKLLFFVLNIVPWIALTIIS
jgi:hypothetical protein